MNLKDKATQIKKEILRVAFKNKLGHVASSLSCLEILVALYYEIMDIEDRLVFSKAHGCYSLYTILYDKGLIDRDTWDNFKLPGCATKMPGVSFANGSLGHGLPVATGVAFGLKLQNNSLNVFCIVGDGEMQEGSNWEAIQFGVKHQLNNLTIIVDDNRLQAMDYRANIMDVHENALESRFKGFGLNPWVCDGHNIGEITDKLDFMSKTMKGYKPNLLIAKTVKGKDIPCMENVAKFHFRSPGCV